jgi:hypothetical protein
LGAGLAEIYDGKPTMSQSRSALVFQPGPGSIRSAMLLGVIEALQQIERSDRALPEESRYAAHDD